MCEMHFYRCMNCNTKWTFYKKLASCESSEPEARCPSSLCMHVGNQKRPQKKECEACQHKRELAESMQDYSDDEGLQLPTHKRQAGGRYGGGGGGSRGGT
ncbi:uncharacterized protein PpBr36_06709 [Pyricularia pennisetigena]|uniref:uncharacterized protein n=1 Tax=Pyricularia pennisetigena TaxID=1578925 RepID=UPI00115088DC|nr:uncharacterized protein PpBr36_06709 [Pyricularia pennisetigena]TLS22726.1 hypothetical protein PpBr36_06709 [Pyricularia pennisetigena]